VSNSLTGVEIIGGGRNKISDSNITVKGNGKGIVLDNTYDNQINNVNVLLESEKQFFSDLKSFLIDIQDSSENLESNKTYKQEAIDQVQKIIDLNDRNSFKTNTLDLISLLSSWITIKAALVPVLSPYVTELIKLAAGC
jgi:hypothetical protein